MHFEGALNLRRFLSKLGRFIVLIKQSKICVLIVINYVFFLFAAVNAQYFHSTSFQRPETWPHIFLRQVATAAICLGVSVTHSLDAPLRIQPLFSAQCAYDMP